MRPRHEFLDHTSETVLRARGESYAEMAAEAARALGTLEGAGQPRTADRVEVRVAVAGDDPPGLLVDFLNEVLFQCETLSFAPTEVTAAADRVGIDAVLAGPRLAMAPSAVKAVTRHAARAEPEGDGWIGEVTLDV